MTDWCIKNKKSRSLPPLLLLPGWGFTGQILAEHPVFAGESLVYSRQLTHPDLLTGLLDFLATENIIQVRVLGWSMGGNLALDFLRMEPHYVASLVLVAVRNHWSAAELAMTRSGLSDATGKGMSLFYRKCFLGAKADLKGVSSQLETGFYESDVALLDAGLSYLGRFTMPEFLPLPVQIIQGDRDVICPVSEMVHFSSPTTTEICTGAGHFLFSHSGFKL